MVWLDVGLIALADGHGDVQAAQITAGTSELRDITKMERIGESNTASPTPLTPCRRTLAHPGPRPRRPTRTARKRPGHGRSSQSPQSSRHDSQDGARGTDSRTCHLVCWTPFNRQDRHRTRYVVATVRRGTLTLCRHGTDAWRRRPFYHDRGQRSLFALHVQNRSPHTGHSEKYWCTYQGRNRNHRGRDCRDSNRPKPHGGAFSPGFGMNPLTHVCRRPRRAS